MILWFLVIAVTGAHGHRARIRRCWLRSIRSMASSCWHRTRCTALAIIGGVFLSLTGGEALYADMGHFGKTRCGSPGSHWSGRRCCSTISGRARCCWSTGHSIEHPLYVMVPATVLPWMLILATAATVIASQAVISGAFSVARQAVQLDLLPRIRILQTSAQEQGQIYVPVVNTLQFWPCVAFVLGFKSSEALSGAYGAAVVGTMFMTNILGASSPRPNGIGRVGESSRCSCRCSRWIPFSWRQPDQAEDGRLDTDHPGSRAVLRILDVAQRPAELRAALARLAVPRKDLAKVIDGSHARAGHGSVSRE